MVPIHLRLMWKTVSLCLAGTVAVALFCSSLFAGEGEAKKVQGSEAGTAATTDCSGARMLKLPGGRLPWFDLAVIIEDANDGVKVTRPIPLPEDFPKPASLAEGTVIKTFLNKPVTTAAEMIAQYDKLKVGDTVALSFELKGRRGELKFVKPKTSGDCIKIKK